MRAIRRSALPVLLFSAVGLVVGLAAPAAGREASHLINGASIKEHSIAGDRLKANTVTGAQVKESTLGTVPKATTAMKLPPLKWHAVTFAAGSGWSNATTPGSRPAAYAVDAQGIVHLRGMITGGTYTLPAFKLPPNVAPSNLILDLPFVAYGGTEGSLLIEGGEVIPFAAQNGTTANVTTLTMLEGVTFDS
ncbi:hypothetical protein [Mycobacterium sp.]|jgi:hypothetical protein|uniref:hypothetical protein n=1 Tax=Mycobacterium sp. TaxID=1785 RepID=UPI003BAEA3D3